MQTLVQNFQKTWRCHGIPWHQTADDNSAFQIAASNGNDAIVKYLMEEVHDEVHDEVHSSILRIFLQVLDASCLHSRKSPKHNLSTLSDEKYGSIFSIDPAADDNCAIQGAASNGHLDVVNYLMGLDSKYGIDPTADDNCAIQFAALNGHLDVVKCLMGLDSKYGIDPAADDNRAIKAAALKGHLDVVEYLMDIQSIGLRALSL